MSFDVGMVYNMSLRMLVATVGVMHAFCYRMASNGQILKSMVFVPRHVLSSKLSATKPS